MTKQTPVPHRLKSLRLIVSAVLFGVVAVVLYVHRSVLQASLHAIRHAHAGWLLLALGLMALTFCIAASIYSVLALHRLRYLQTFTVEVASAFVNRLLPAGIGALGLHGRYLFKRKHTSAEATVVVSVNNLVGMLGHLLLLGGVALFSPAAFRQFSAHYHIAFSSRVLVGVTIVGGILLLIPGCRRRIVAFASNLLTSLRKFRLWNVARALLLAVLLTATYTMLLFSATQSVNIQITVVQVFIVFSIGVLASTVTPTPGGLVGAEAGLYAGLMAFNAHPAPAGAAVLLYRLITYWLPLLPGYAALLLARRQKLV